MDKSRLLRMGRLPENSKQSLRIHKMLCQKEQEYEFLTSLWGRLAQ